METQGKGSVRVPCLGVSGFVGWRDAVPRTASYDHFCVSGPHNWRITVAFSTEALGRPPHVSYKTPNGAEPNSSASLNLSSISSCLRDASLCGSGIPRSAENLC